MSETLRRFLEEHRRLLVVLAALLVADAALYLFALAPLRLRVEALGDQFGEESTRLAAAREAYGRALFEVGLLRAADERTRELYTGTFQRDRERFPVVDAKIKEIAGRFRLAPSAYGYGWQPLAREGLEQLRISFNLKGGYDNLRQFLAAIEQARDESGRDLFFAVEQVTLADSSESGSELNLTVAVTTYFHKPELAEEQEARARRGGTPAPRRGGRT